MGHTLAAVLKRSSTLLPTNDEEITF